MFTYIIIQMSRAQFMRKVDPFESDDEEEVVVKKTVVSTPVVKKPFVQRHYLFVPYSYKDDAKNLGAKFDGNKKQWYTQDDNPNKDILINKYHSDNFIHSDSRATKLKPNPLTLTQVKEKEDSDLKRYLAEKDSSDFKKYLARKIKNELDFERYLAKQGEVMVVYNDKWEKEKEFSYFTSYIAEKEREQWFIQNKSLDGFGEWFSKTLYPKLESLLNNK